ncbi:MAG TPA: XdhC/CoxI family protein [Anaerolineae bacterium]|nr:XdhC/CoxI family protein [Anaerolineae bacterium]HOR00348.1 XdhC/CoxI family protein [Anaerolineae bacterium]HPL26928.1 XdhC/CoxI family protein [Anaerolineae bacterium]
MDELFSAIAQALHAGEALALATVVHVEGSTPRSVGAQMAVWASGRTLGTVGGGTLEARTIRDSLAALAEGVSTLQAYSLHSEEPGALGVCGGRAQVFIHVLQPPETVLIAGAGHVAQPLAQAATAAGFGVLVVDDRPELLTPERFPTARTQVVCFAELRAALHFDQRTHAIIVTRSHAHDQEVLQQLLGEPLAYLGVMGSRAKVRHMFQRLREAGYPEEQLARVHAPIGLDIGAETPAEIAVSIVAELLQHRRGASGLPLSQVARTARGEEGTAP